MLIHKILHSRGNGVAQHTSTWMSPAKGKRVRMSYLNGGDVKRRTAERHSKLRDTALSVSEKPAIEMGRTVTWAPP